MSTQITNYQCPACTGPLRYDGESGKLKCDYCESSFTIEEVEALFADKNEKAEMATVQEPPVSSEWGEDAGHMRAYSCPSCGAELICEETTAATACPYCGNPTVVPGQFGGTKKPDCIIPFKLSKEQAVAALKKHYQGKPLLPKEFADENHLQEIKGVYVPFWLFDGQADADVTFKTTRSHTRSNGKERIITTEHFEVWRKGFVPFSHVPVDGASKMPDSHMDAIEPFDYQDLKPFSLSYLPGFLADKYDVSAEECASRAEERCRSSAVSAMRGTVVGYESCVPMREDVTVRHSDVQYALLPVWLLSTKWKNQNYLFAMNGQTGKLIGDLPISWVRFWTWFGGFFAASAAVMSLIRFVFL